MPPLSLISTFSTKPHLRPRLPLLKSLISPFSTKPRPRLPFLSLKQFLLRARVLSLYRAVLRATSPLPAPARAELREWARAEIERNRGVEGEDKIKYLVALGREDLRRLGGWG